MTDLDLATYKNLYLKTARQHINDLKNNIAVLNLNSTDKKVIYEVFRLFHSFKSQNYFMGFQKTAHLCKVFEKFFQEINEGKKIYNPGMSNIIFDGIRKLENSLNAIDENNTEVDLVQDIINLQISLGQL